MIRVFKNCSVSIRLMVLWAVAFGAVFENSAELHYGIYAAELGDFAIGHKRFEFVDENRNERTLPVDVWYPVDQADAFGPLSSYQIGTVDGFSLPSSIAFADASVSVAEPFPLVVSSHGGGLFSAQFSSMNELLASHGFIVAAPNHTGYSIDEVLGERWEPRQVAVDRLTDVGFVMDSLLAMNEEPGGPLLNRIDRDEIGATGHSVGAVTVLRAHQGSDELGFTSDDRIKAILGISPGGGPRYGFELTKIAPEVPSFFVGGSLDFAVSQDIFRRSDYEPRYLAVIDGATHSSYHEVCDRLPATTAEDAPETVQFVFNYGDPTGPMGVCSDDVIRNSEAIDITDAYAVAFFKTYLTDDDEFEYQLSEAYVLKNQLPVEFESATSIIGDVDQNGVLDGNDIDRLAVAIRTGNESLQFDVNGDLTVDTEDHRYLVEAQLGTYFGDANLDDEFNSGDLVQVFKAAEYEDEIANNSVWAEGDWSGDGEFDTADMVLAFRSNSFESGPRPKDSLLVPEPSSLAIPVLVMLVLSRQRRITRDAHSSI